MERRPLRSGAFLAIGVIAGSVMAPVAREAGEAIAEIAAIGRQQELRETQDAVVTALTRIAPRRVITVGGLKMIETTIVASDAGACQEQLDRARKDGGEPSVAGRTEDGVSCQGATYPLQITIRHTPGVDV